LTLGAFGKKRHHGTNNSESIIGRASAVSSSFRAFAKAWKRRDSRALFPFLSVAVVAMPSTASLLPLIALLGLLSLGIAGVIGLGLVRADK
jgi:ABC-type glycerol-3-phosphate transport system permease component